jgi:tetratricopeptide (TPR) repeat protein
MPWGSPRLRNAVLLALAFCILGGLIFANALDNPFHFDDLHSIEHNPHIRSLANLPRFFYDLRTFSSEPGGTMFRPLLLSSYAFNYALHGQRVRGYRIFNLLLHLSCSLLVAALVRRLGGGEIMSVAGGLIFLVHPLHGEPINYISSRSDLLASFFFLSSLVLLVRQEADFAWGGYLFFAGGLLSKSIAITLPVVGSLCQAWARGAAYLKTQGRKYALLGAMGLAYVLVIFLNRFLPQSMAKSPRSLDVQVWTQFKAYIYYMWLFAMPVRLSVDHQFFVADSLFEPAVLGAGLVLASVIALALFRFKCFCSLGFIWFAITLLPASLMPLNILASERRMYLASAGLSLAVVWAWHQLYQREGNRAVLLGVLMGLIFAFSSFARNEVWASRIGLWEDAVAKGPLVPRVRVNLALAYNREGWSEKAMEQLEAALGLKPDFADAWVELGNIQHERGLLAEAEQAYGKALKTAPHLSGVYYNLGNIHQQRGDVARAIVHYQEALRRNPGFAQAHNNLGQAYEATGWPEQGLEEYQKALDLDPDLPQAWYNLAVLSEKRGEVQRARRAFEKAHALLVADERYAKNPQYQEFARRALEGIGRLSAAE